MPNNNLADISTFESIQSEQHNRTSINSMSVFNDISDAKKAADRVSKAVQQEAAARAESDKAVEALTDVLRREHKRISDITDVAAKEKEKQQLKSIVSAMKVPDVYDSMFFVRGVEAIK
ncbi:MAG: hypothetical protein LBP87_06715 [Planctomycetaceae bacterium]|jgi:uncharacterized protein HemY|nr:hypothetical protein [Planctomycetaceae bacterium]